MHSRQVQFLLNSRAAALSSGGALPATLSPLTASGAARLDTKKTVGVEALVGAAAAALLAAHPCSAAAGVVRCSQ